MEALIKENLSFYEKILELVAVYGVKVLFALLTLLVGVWIINRVTRYVMNKLDTKDFDPTLRLYLTRIVSVGMKIMLLFSVANMVGIHTTSFMAVLGAAGLAVGLALQGSLSNFAGGVLMLVLRPFKVGDYIHAQGEEGLVTAIDIFNTTLLKVDNRRVIIPNGPLIGGTIINATAEELRRVDVNVGISYSDDFVKVQELLQRLAKSDSRIASEPPPFIGVTGFGDSCVNITFRTWCKTPDYWDVYFSMYSKTKETFDANNITIPFPQREIRNITVTK